MTYKYQIITALKLHPNQVIPYLAFPFPRFLSRFSCHMLSSSKQRRFNSISSVFSNYIQNKLFCNLFFSVPWIFPLFSIMMYYILLVFQCQWSQWSIDSISLLCRNYIKIKLFFLLKFFFVFYHNTLNSIILQ